MWGSGFREPPDPAFFRFQRSFAFDRRLLPYEICSACAWAEALARAGLLDPAERDLVLQALDELAADISRQAISLDGSPAEDVHDFVERQLVERIGETGYKLHTGRSRNELIANDLRMFVRDATQEISSGVIEVCDALLALARKYLGAALPGFTHLRPAQPLLLAHQLLAYVEMLFRDLKKLQQAAEEADVLVLGSGALAGCAFPVDRAFLGERLGFRSISRNSLDAVSDRDFLLSYVFALENIAIHLSRLAEDWILFSTEEFGFIRLPDSFTTGSSLMPQKKNPDLWELARGKTGRVLGSLVGLFTLFKGLPLGYQKDLQEDKEGTFAAHDAVRDLLCVLAAALRATEFDVGRMAALAEREPLLATDMADYLVRRGVPFRTAHRIIAELIAMAHGAARSVLATPLEELKRLSPAFEADFYDSISLERSLAARNVPGGTAPEQVGAAVGCAEQQLSRWRAVTQRSRLPASGRGGT
jgi:argininosuccinate lyase